MIHIIRRNQSSYSLQNVVMQNMGLSTLKIISKICVCLNHNDSQMMYTKGQVDTQVISISNST